CLPEVPVFLAEVIAYHAVNDESSVDLLRSGEGFAAGQVAPFVRADDAAGFQPSQIGRKSPGDVGARGIGRADLARRAGQLPDLCADAIDLVEIGAHAFQHHA